MNEPCQASLWPDFNEFCGRTDTRLYAACCEHEHLKERWYCAETAAKAELGKLICTPCRTHPSHPHRCESRLVELAP
jgi:hypothetical protein